LNANSPFQYTIQPVSLDVIKKPNAEYAHFVQSQQKVASADSYRPAFNLSQRTEAAPIGNSDDVMTDDFAPQPGVSDSMMERWSKRNAEVEKARNTVGLIDKYIYATTHGGNLRQKSASIIGEAEEPYVINLHSHSDDPFDVVQGLLESAGERQLMHEVEMEVDRSKCWTNYINEDPTGLSREVHLEFSHHGLCRNASCPICAHPREQQQKVASITLGKNNNIRTSRTVDASQYKPKFSQIAERLSDQY